MPNTSPRFLLVALSLVAALPGCNQDPKPAATMLVERLYFGRSMAHGVVTDAQFASFLADSVTPRFPDGLTEYQAHGQWRTPAGQIIAEDTMVIEIAMPDSQANRDKVRDLIAEYKTRFAQESVMRLEEPARVMF